MESRIPLAEESAETSGGGTAQVERHDEKTPERKQWGALRPSPPIDEPLTARNHRAVGVVKPGSAPLGADVIYGCANVNASGAHQISHDDGF
jgi:hypothetical protein